MPYESHDWYWRFHAGLPARPEDREAIKRFAPELFSRDYHPSNYPQPHNWHDGEFWVNVLHWATEGDRWSPTVTVQEGTCVQPDCPLRLGRPRKSASTSSASA